MPKVTLEYKELVRTRILESALHVFSEKGYHEATMDEIAKRLDLSKPALYRYYDSKEELFREILEQFIQTTAKALRESFKSSRFDPETFFSLVDKWGWTPNLFFSAAAEASRNRKLRKVFSDGYNTAVDMVATFVEDLKNRGIIKAETNSRRLAMGAIALQDGLLVGQVVGLRLQETRSAFVDTIQAIFSGLLVGR